MVGEDLTSGGELNVEVGEEGRGGGEVPASGDEAFQRESASVVVDKEGWMCTVRLWQSLVGRERPWVLLTKTASPGHLCR